MNIYVTSYNAKECVKFLDDTMIPAVISQTTDILNDAILLQLHPGIHLENSCNEAILTQTLRLHKHTNTSHQCVIWANKSSGNFDWLFRYWCYLQDKHLTTFGFYHDTYPLIAPFASHESCIPYGEFTTPPNCAFDDSLRVDFRGLEDVCHAYQLLIHAQSAKARAA